MSNKVVVSVTLYEENGEATKGIPAPTMQVRSHWNWTDRVVLEFDGKSVTVLERDLLQALRSCCQ